MRGAFLRPPECADQWPIRVSSGASIHRHPPPFPAFCAGNGPGRATLLEVHSETVSPFLFHVATRGRLLERFCAQDSLTIANPFRCVKGKCGILSARDEGPLNDPMAPGELSRTSETCQNPCDDDGLLENCRTGVRNPFGSREIGIRADVHDGVDRTGEDRSRPESTVWTYFHRLSHRFRSLAGCGKRSSDLP